MRQRLGFATCTMKLKFYPILCTRSRRALLRQRHQRRRNFTYQPSSRLLISLSDEFNMSKEEVAEQLHKEREFLLKLQKGL
jgi:hypothetical protein